MRRRRSTQNDPGNRTCIAATACTVQKAPGAGGAGRGCRPVRPGGVLHCRASLILATLAYTAWRAGAIAKLRLQDFQHDGEQYVLRFQEKGGKSREIPVRLELQGDILGCLGAAGIGGDAKDWPLFRSTVRKTKQLTANALTSKAICEMVKRRLKAANLPVRLSPHSFRVYVVPPVMWRSAATILG
jgi:integrase/recombinase XerD